MSQQVDDTSDAPMAAATHYDRLVSQQPEAKINRQIDIIAPPVLEHTDRSTSARCKTSGGSRIATRQTSRPRKTRFYRTLTSAPALFVCMTIVLPGLMLGFRHQIVAAIPPTAKLYALGGLAVNLDGLELREVASIVEKQKQGKFLVISGKIVSLRNHRIQVPSLRLALRANKGQKIYSWQAPSPKSYIEPGKSLNFVARLATPPDTAQVVQIQFNR